MTLGILTAVLWVSFALIVYVYIGYPLLIHWIARIRPWPGGERGGQPAELPPVTMIIPAHNEERWIERKIENTLALDYPRDRMQILVASDGSTDRTVEIAHRFEDEGRVSLVVFPTRHGKQEMLNQLVPKATGEIIAASDANALREPNALRLLVRHFADPQVGCVSGNRTCVVQPQSKASIGEGLYWRYEAFIKSAESLLHSCIGAQGQLYAARKSIFPHVEKVGEDFYIPMKIIESTGMRVIFEPRAMTHIPAAASLKVEFERKTRAHVSGLLTMELLPNLLVPFRTPVWWQLMSHQLLRMAVPPALAVLFLASCCLLQNSLYWVIFLLQCIFYALALVGFFLLQVGKKPKICYVPFYFVFANLALGLALIRWPFRKFDYAWERTERIPVSN